MSKIKLCEICLDNVEDKDYVYDENSDDGPVLSEEHCSECAATIKTGKVFIVEYKENSDQRTGKYVAIDVDVLKSLFDITDKDIKHGAIGLEPEKFKVACMVAFSASSDEH